MLRAELTDCRKVRMEQRHGCLGIVPALVVDVAIRVNVSLQQSLERAMGETRRRKICGDIFPYGHKMRAVKQCKTAHQ